MGNNILSQKKSWFLFGVFAVLAFVLLYIVPYTRDDWAWGSSIGIERLTDLFKDYNGRYAGNIVEIILTRFRWLRALVETSVICGLVYFMAPRGKNRLFFYILGICMILLEPVVMLRQTVVYTAGFSNYVIPTLFMIIFIRYYQQLIFTDRKEPLTFKNIHIVPIGIAAFISCLFMEHVTLYLLGLSVVIIIYSLIKFRKVFAVEISFLVGSLAGVILMFSNGAYWNVLNGSDTYRSLSNAPATGSSDNNISEIIFHILVGNWFVNILLCIAFILVLKKYKGHLKEKLMSKSGLFLIFLFCSIVIINLPLIIVNPISPRCFFPAFILLGILIMECLNRVKLPEWKTKVTVSFMALAFAILFIVYIPLYKADVDRVSYIKEEVAKGKTEIVIDNLPNEYFVWVITPESGTKWERRYKLFYNIPEEVTLFNKGQAYEKY